MRAVRIINITKKIVIAEQAWVADTFYLRARGLIGRPPLRHGEAMIIEPCSAVHSLGLFYPIDVAFVNGDGEICRMLRPLRPNSLGPFVRGSRFVIELPAGALERLGVSIGDVLEVRK